MRWRSSREYASLCLFVRGMSEPLKYILFVCLFVLLIYLFIYLFISLFVYLFIYLFIFEKMCSEYIARWDLTLLLFIIIHMLTIQSNISKRPFRFLFHPSQFTDLHVNLLA